MLKLFAPAAAAVALVAAGAAAPAHAARLSDAQIANIAYTAGKLDIAAAKQALAKSKDKAVLDFANEMVRDHTAVNDKALALVKKLKVTPEDNPTSQTLTKDQDAKRAEFAKLSGKSFDKHYIDNEVTYHRTVNDALEKQLIPDAQNPELKG